MELTPASRRRPGGRALALAALLALGVVSGVLLFQRSPSAPPPAAFVGRAACAGCHARESALWETSDHARAMNPVGEGSVLGRFDGSTLKAHGVTSTFFTRDGRPWIRTDGPDGTPQDYPVTHSFGADPLQQYLVGFPRGRVQVPGLCWDSRPAAAGGGRWFPLYPEAIPPGDELHWTGPMQNWNFMCAECHVTGYRKNYDAREDRFKTFWSELNVSCEACHGPGSRHVAWAGRKPAEREEDETRGLDVLLKEGLESRWIFDPGQAIARPQSRRPQRAEVETCARCHARRAQLNPEYRHGRPLADTHRISLLDEGLYHADGQILDEVYEYGSFLQSKMHRASVTCSNCHEPHAARLRFQGNALCAQCHQPARYDVETHHHHRPDGPGARCVDCHMPSRVYMGVDARRDHGFRVPRPDLTASLGTPNACAACHADRTADWAAAAVASWTGGRRPPEHFGEILHAGRRGGAGADLKLAELAGNPEAAPIVRGTALSLLAGIPGPRQILAARRGLRDEEILVRQGALSALSTADPRTRAELLAPLLRDPVGTLRLQAAEGLIDTPADLLPSAERPVLEGVLKEWIAVQEHHADRPEGQLNLGNLALRRGRLPEAEAAFRRARDLLPALAPPHVNLAEALSLQERLPEAEAVLREGLKRVTNEAPLRHSLGLLLVRQGRRAEALPELERAARLAPRMARFAYVHAVGVESQGDRAAAIRLLEEALEYSPHDRDVLAALAQWSAASGDRVRALRWARRLREAAPEDPATAALLESLEK